MKNKILELIRHHREAKQEVNMLLEELSQIESSKLSYQEDEALESLKVRYENESAWRGVFLSQLEDLL